MPTILIFFVSMSYKLLSNSMRILKDYLVSRVLNNLEGYEIYLFFDLFSLVVEIHPVVVSKIDLNRMLELIFLKDLFDCRLGLDRPLKYLVESLLPSFVIFRNISEIVFPSLFLLPF